MVILDSCAVGSNAYGVVQAAQCINKTQFQCIVTCPNTSSGYAVDKFGAQPASFGHATHKDRVELLYIALHQFQHCRRQWPHWTQCRRVGVGVYGVGGDAQIALQGASNLGQRGKNTNRTRYCRRLCNDIVGVARNLISCRCRYIAHRHNHRLLLLRPHHGVGHNLRRCHLAAGRIHTQHYSLYLLVLCGVVQRFGYVVRIDGSSYAASCNNISFGIYHRDLVFAYGLLLQGL